MASLTVAASSGVLAAPKTNGATGLPKRHRLSAYHTPATAAVDATAAAAGATRRSRHDVTAVHVTTATATPSPGYFAPAATPAKIPAAAASPIVAGPSRQKSAPAVAASSSRSSFADAT